MKKILLANILIMSSLIGSMNTVAGPVTAAYMMHGIVTIENTHTTPWNLSLYHNADIQSAAYLKIPTLSPFSFPFSLIVPYDNKIEGNYLWLNASDGSVCLLKVYMNNFDSFSIKQEWSRPGYQCILSGDPNKDNFNITIKKLT